MPAPKDPQKREEWLRNLSESHKGQTGSMTGRKHTPEALAKMSAASTGRKLSPEARVKVSEALRHRVRKPMSDETKAKMSASKTGHKYPNAKGHSQGPAMRAKISAHYASLSPEEQGAFNEKRLKAVRNKDTNLEAYVARQFDKDGIVYKQQGRIGRYVVDFLIANQNLIVECNGC